MNGGIKVKKIRKFIITLGIVGGFIITAGLMETWAQGYTLQAVCLDCDSDLVCTFQTVDGDTITVDNCYFLPGEPVTIKMHDNYTSGNLNDDVVLDVVSNN